MVEEFFRTPRLIFRPFAMDDLDDLARIASDPEAVRRLPRWGPRDPSYPVT